MYVCILVDEEIVQRREIKKKKKNRTRKKLCDINTFSAFFLQSFFVFSFFLFFSVFIRFLFNACRHNTHTYTPTLTREVQTRKKRIFFFSMRKKSKLSEYTIIAHQQLLIVSLFRCKAFCTILNSIQSKNRNCLRYGMKANG